MRGLSWIAVLKTREGKTSHGQDSQQGATEVVGERQSSLQITAGEGCARDIGRGWGETQQNSGPRGIGNWDAEEEEGQET